MQPGAILTDEYLTAALELGAPRARIAGMWAEFVDYWIGVPGQRGTKLDWLATWRNDVRRKLERGHTRNGHATVASVGSAFDDLIARAEGDRGEAGYGDLVDITDASPQGR